MAKTAIVLFNLGGPDSAEAVRPFLMNFFMDRNIIRLPYPFRYLLASLIARRRSQNEAKASYGEIGGSSPLLANTTAQADALQQQLGNDYKVFVCMRYWHPMSPAVVRDVQAWGAEQIILLPLYPQYSTTTTRSSFQVWTKAAKAANLNLPTRMVCCYPWNEQFIAASAAAIRPLYEQALRETGKTPRVLFSAHGLPENIIKSGDPYQWQCEQSAAKIVEKLNIPGIDWQICYQSRVGRLKWIGPSTEEAIHKAVEDGVPVVIYPHAFTQEHVETLVELDIEYRHVAEGLGIAGYYRAPTVGTSATFIDGLAEMVKTLPLSPAIHPDNGTTPLCPSGFKDCCMRQFG